MVGFHHNSFARPERLVDLINRNAKRMKLRPDHRIFIAAETGSPEERLKRVRTTVEELARLAA